MKFRLYVLPYCSLWCNVLYFEKYVHCICFKTGAFVTNARVFYTCTSLYHAVWGLVSEEAILDLAYYVFRAVAVSVSHQLAITRNTL